METCSSLNISDININWQYKLNFTELNIKKKKQIKMNTRKCLYFMAMVQVLMAFGIIHSSGKEELKKT